MKRVALIPARSGSRRLVGKNLVEIHGYPMIAYSIFSALESGVFDQVVVSTDSKEIASVAEHYGAKVPQLRPEALSQELSPDIDWVSVAINHWLDLSDEDIFSILRPTNPLRSAKVIRSAMELFDSFESAHSLRAIRSIKEHPNKMWRRESDGRLISPFKPSLNVVTGIESHSSPMQALEILFVQDASLEICQVWVARRLHSLTGTRVLGFEMPGFEGLDINYPEDLEYLKFLLESDKATLPNRPNNQPIKEYE